MNAAPGTRPRLPFALACLAAIAAIAIYIVVTNWRASHRAGAAPTPPVHLEYITTAPAAPFILFRDVSQDVQDASPCPACRSLDASSKRQHSGSGSVAETRLVTPLAAPRLLRRGSASARWRTRCLPVRYFAYGSIARSPEHTIALTGPTARARVRRWPACRAHRL